MTTVFSNHYRVFFYGNPDKGQDFVPWVKQIKSPIKEGLKIVCLGNTAKNWIIFVSCVHKAVLGY